MNKLFAVLLFFPVIAFGHSQTPALYGGKNNIEDAISLSDYKEVTFTVRNLNQKAAQYEIFVNDIKVDETRILSENSSQQVTVQLITKELKKPVTYSVCSRAKVTSGMRTKICSRVQLVRM